MIKKILATSTILITSLLLTACENTEEQKILSDLNLEIKEFEEATPVSDLNKIGNEQNEDKKIEEKNKKEIKEEIKEDKTIVNKTTEAKTKTEEKNVEIVKTIEEFSKCITKNGAKIYGTTWCSHCQDQKKMFGDSSKNLDFTDCDVDRRGCKDAGITGYPTWKIGGNLFPGVQSFEVLGKKTGCKLVQ